MDTGALIWNLITSFFVGLVMFMLKQASDEQKRIQILLNRTREEIARENVTQAEIDKIVAYIDGRFDKLNDKLDAYIKEQRSSLG